MQLLAVALVLISAAMHATWNLLAKRSVDPLAFFLGLNIAALVIWGVPFAVMLVRHPVSSAGLLFILLSGCLHVVYFTSLGLAYKGGALSAVYPIARGTGVFIVPLLAIPLFDERPTAPAGVGIAMILAGLAVIALSALRVARSERGGLGWAFITGLTIATYSLVDNAGVDRVHPMVYVYAQIFVASVLLTPYIASRKRPEFSRELRLNWRSMIVGGVLSLGAYLIVLTAMRLANVGYVVPLRETSVVFGTLFGVVLLGEPAGRRRISAAPLVGAGAIVIAIWG